MSDVLLTLDEVLDNRRVPTRDCRDCAFYEPHADGLACGWCRAHSQWVKLYHSPQIWHTQCQFKMIRRPRRWM